MDGTSIGFSGTRKGMSFKQKSDFGDWLMENHEMVTEFHHGMCIGADTEAHEIVRLGFANIKIHGHPGFPEDHATRGVKDADVDILHPILAPLTRNLEIVHGTRLMFFAPTFPEKQRSGTWATLRFCRRKKLPIVVLARGTFKNPEGAKA